MPFLSNFSSSSSSRVESPLSPPSTPFSKPPPIPLSSHARRLTSIRRSQTLNLDRFNNQDCHTRLFPKKPVCSNNLFHTRPLRNVAYSSSGLTSGTSTPLSFTSRSPSPNNFSLRYYNILVSMH